MRAAEQTRRMIETAERVQVERDGRVRLPNPERAPVVVPPVEPGVPFARRIA